MPLASSSHGSLRGQCTWNIAYRRLDNPGGGSPAELLPFRTRQILIVGTEDAVMPLRARDAYIAAATKAGDRAESVVVAGAGHFETIAPTSAAWPIVRDKILELLQP